MPAPRPFTVIGTEDQWQRASHQDTALVGGVVQLFWRDEVPAPTAGGAAGAGAGLAFDSHCRLFHSVPEEGRVERILWAAADPLRPAEAQPSPVDLFEPVVMPPLGDFTSAQPEHPGLREPRGLAVDVDDRLFIADAAGRCVLVFDLWSRRLLRRVPLAASPLDLAVHGRWVLALVASPPGLLKLTARAEPRPVALPAGVTQPSRLAVSPT